jgi:hypothetical protein
MVVKLANDRRWTIWSWYFSKIHRVIEQFVGIKRGMTATSNKRLNIKMPFAVTPAIESGKCLDGLLAQAVFLPPNSDMGRVSRA